jgi:DNA-binding CsgD family transcriptional regulator
MYEDVSPPPVGRVAELSLIAGFVRKAKATGAALILSGEPGVGKTFLLDQAAKIATASGITVLRGRGVHAEADVTFGVLNQVLLPLARYSPKLEDIHRRALEAPLGAADIGIPDRLQVSAALIELLRLAREDSPLVLIIDDLPLLDRLSADVLGFLSRRMSGSRIGFLAASRHNDDSFFDNSCLPVHTLAPLTEEHAGELLASRFPALEGHVRARILAEARGNPLALLDLPSAMSDPQRAGTTALPPALPLTPRLRSVFSATLATLPDTARRLLLLAALDGTGDLRVLAAVRDSEPGPDPLAINERAHLLHLDEIWQRLAFTHPLVRSSIIELAPDEEHRTAHQDLAALYSDDPDRSAWHSAAAAREPDERVAAQLENAALRSFCRGDASGALAALIRAAELSESQAECRRRLARAAVTGVGLSGERLRASSLLMNALRQDGDLHGSLDAKIAASYLMISHAGEIDAAHQLLVGAIGEITSLDSGSPDEMALYALMIICFFGGRPGLWQPVHDAIDRIGPGIPETLRLCSETFADPVSASQHALRRLSSAIGSVPHDDAVGVIRTGFAAIFVDRLAECRTALRKVVRDGHMEGGPVVSAIHSLNMLGIDDFQTGQWGQSAGWAAESLRLCEERDYVLLAYVARFVQASLAAAQGDFAQTRALTDEMLGWAVPRHVRAIECYAWQARALAAAGAGDCEESYRCATRIAPAGHLPSHVPHVLYVALDLVESCIRTTRRAEATAHVAAMEEAGIAAISPRLRLAVTGCKALVTPDPRAAHELFAEALAAPEADRWPFEYARIQLLYGERLRRYGATRESRAQLAAALERFQWLGAHPWASRALEELRATGHARTRGVPHGAEPLTAREQQIATLAAGGLRNKDIAEQLFLSERTVATHLRRAFPKLGVTSRAALRDALASATSGAQ